MPEISRPQAIQTIASTSAAALSSMALAGCKQSQKAALAAVPDPSNLYLIFTGAWVLCLENNQINVMTTHSDEHSYDLGVSRPAGQPRMPLEKDQVYTVNINGYSPASTISNLLSPLAGQALILQGVACKPIKPAGARTISLPMPSSIGLNAILDGVTLNVGTSTVQKQWPTAFALVYSGPWTYMTVTSSDGPQPMVNVSADTIPYSHLSFRTCLTTECNMSPDPTVHCDKVNKDIAHAKKVFGSLTAMLDFGSRSAPTLDFPPCTQGASGGSDKWPVTIECGLDNNIDPTEVGMPENGCNRYAHLHNCAAGTIIVTP